MFIKEIYNEYLCTMSRIYKLLCVDVLDTCAMTAYRVEVFKYWFRLLHIIH
jgi:hypothetical protein